MQMIETSLYASQRTVRELQTLASAGLTTIVEPVTYMGTPRRSVHTYMDDYERLITTEAERCAGFGIEHLTLVGVPAPDARYVQAAAQAIEAMPQYLKRPGVVGIGEVGLETCSDEEFEILRRQLRLARETGYPVVIQAPTHRKAHAVGLSLQLAADEYVERQRIMVKGLDEETVAMVKSFGAWAGLTIHPLFLSHERAIKIIAHYGTEGFMLQSDAGRGYGDPYAVPNTLHYLAEAGLSRSKQAELAYHNPKWFYSQGIGAQRHQPSRQLAYA